MSGTPVRVVAVPLKEFNGWAGGVDFVRMILEGLLHDPALRVVALLPRPTWVKRARQFPGSILAALKGRRPERPMDPRQVRAALADFAPRLAFHVYPDSRRGLRAALVAVGADVAIPCLRPMPASPVPWVGYLYDFQHRYFPQLFSQAERDGRDLAFARMLAAAPVVICNSDAVRADAERFHPGSAARIVVLPFAPIVRPAWLDLDPGPARRRHAVPERYFMVCNQFWIHKDHPTAIRAFAAFLQAGGDPATALVCTGGLQDFRDPGYPGTIRALIAQLNLTGKVHLLGHLAKDEQIALLRGAIAVLQPTWFEGGRGGGAASDALALGVPALLSDIAVNQEIVQDGCRFFPKGDPVALAALMLEQASAPAPRPDRAELLSRAEAGIQRLSHCLAGAIELAGPA